jgi:Beta xylosidase C-terminal Concanavalin A-like domain
MNKADTEAFAKLFDEAYERCFGYVMKSPLTESESKLFSTSVYQSTGLIIGWKSLKNYSQYFINGTSSKQENPSIATLDTLARYVMRAPRTDEIKRKEEEDHHPYWFEYRNQFRRGTGHGATRRLPKRPILTNRLAVAAISLLVLAILITLVLWWHPYRDNKVEQFSDDFHSLEVDSLTTHGWFVKSSNTAYWNRREDTPGSLTLFTLRGDNWPDSGQTPEIQNLLLRKISSNCFTVEAHLSDFIPQRNWEQAGLILLEDTNFVGKSARLSVVYNDYSGGYPKSRDILIQAITSLGSDFSKPEEIAHKVIFNYGRDSEDVIGENLKHSALRIEKHGATFRFLFSDGAMDNSAFKEIVSREFDMKPKYVGLFAMKGFVSDTAVIPARFKFFRIVNEPCK